MNVIHVSTTERRRGANRERILAAAIELVSEVGVDGLSIAGVAARAGYSPGALYRYFPSKDALVAGAAVVAIERIADDIAPRGLSPLLSIVRSVDSFLRFARDQPSLFALINTLLSDPRVLIADESTGPVVGSIMRALSPVERAIELAQKQGTFTPGDPSTRAVALWVSIQGALQLRKLERLALVSSPQVVFEVLVSMLVGFGASHDEVVQVINTIDEEEQDQ